MILRFETQPTKYLNNLLMHMARHGAARHIQSAYMHVQCSFIHSNSMRGSHTAYYVRKNCKHRQIFHVENEKWLWTRKKRNKFEWCAAPFRMARCTVEVFFLHLISAPVVVVVVFICFPLLQFTFWRVMMQIVTTHPLAHAHAVCIPILIQQIQSNVRWFTC